MTAERHQVAVSSTVYLFPVCPWWIRGRGEAGLSGPGTHARPGGETGRAGERSRERPEVRSEFGRSYSLTPPVVRPAMMLRWKTRKKMTVGIAAMTAAAITTFIGVPPEKA